MVAQATNQPSADDLAETIEVQFTPEIIAKAQELGNNPVKIYNWVRNNIEFVPTYGSIQGAHMTLLTKQGNAFDTASLLIALLRTSNIPARYVYGTIELPIDKVMNWVGGFTDANAALDFIASGGIPVTGIISGGKVTKARLEHVWVESWIDYIPSRGARHKTGQGDTWIPLDASFKQYNFVAGVDLQQAIPFDVESYINQLKSTTILNEQEGFIANMDVAFIQTKFDELKSRLQDYLNANLPNAVAEDIIGKKMIIPQEFPFLPATLLYKTLVTGSKFSAFPDNLGFKITLEVNGGSSIFEPSLTFTASLSELIGKRVTLSCVPATILDQETVNNFGGLYNTPAYLINIKLQLKVEGEVKTEGPPVRMGEMQNFVMTFISPIMGPDQVNNNIISGGYYSICLVPDRLSPAFASVLQRRTKQLDNFAESGGDRFSDTGLGEQLYLSGISYFFELDRVTDAIAGSQKVTYGKQPGEAIFGLSLRETSMFGLPMSIQVTGTYIDVDRSIYFSSSQSGDSSVSKGFMTMVGMFGSSLEHGIIEQFYGIEGISAVKALHLGNVQGLRTYRVNTSNLSNVLPALQVSEVVKADIRNATNAGMEIIISEREIQVNEWVGVGYIILDPATGAGGYLISGGIAGGSGTQPQDLNALTSSQSQSTEGFICMMGSLALPLLLAVIITGILRGPVILAALAPVGIIGLLGIALYIAIILFCVFMVIRIIDACISSITAKRDEGKERLLRYFSQLKKGKGWKQQVKNRISCRTEKFFFLFLS